MSTISGGHFADSALSTRSQSSPESDTEEKEESKLNVRRRPRWKLLDLAFVLTDTERAESEKISGDRLTDVEAEDDDWEDVDGRFAYADGGSSATADVDASGGKTR